MAPVKNAKSVFAAVPEDYPVPGKHIVYDDKETIDLDTVSLNGGVLVKVLYLSIDPYMRGRMQAGNFSSYIPPFELGKSMVNYGVGVVVRSDAQGFKAGDHVYGMLPFQNYAALPAAGLRVLPNVNNVPWSVYIGSVGMPGMTAYSAWKEYSQAKPGETAFISTGAGAVGSMVVQLAKMDGYKVIASAGSDEKVKFMKEIGVDVAFNYKTENTAEILKREGPINVYWDNVGGETLEAAMLNAADGARIIACGAISGYNTGTKPIHTWDLVFRKSLHIHGFIVTRIQDKYFDSFYKDVPQWILSGKVKIREEIEEGLEKAGDLFVAVQKGTNTGKAVIKVADE
ncbi:hypothetical protein HDZ31DRAFT_80845 [Schizophyllum fasciatum]